MMSGGCQGVVGGRGGGCRGDGGLSVAPPALQRVRGASRLVLAGAEGWVGICDRTGRLDAFHREQRAIHRPALSAADGRWGPERGFAERGMPRVSSSFLSFSPLFRHLFHRRYSSSAPASPSPPPSTPPAPSPLFVLSFRNVIISCYYQMHTDMGDERGIRLRCICLGRAAPRGSRMRGMGICSKVSEPCFARSSPSNARSSV